MLQKPLLNSRGAVAEIEFTLVAGDPAVHAMTTRSARGWIEGGAPVIELPVRPLFDESVPHPTPREDPIASAPYNVVGARDAGDASASRIRC